MPFHIRKSLIIGVGLLGASIGLGLKQRKLCDTVVGVGRNTSTLEKALARGAIDRFELTVIPEDYDSELVILCTPVQTAIDILKRIAPYIRLGTTITDVCSTKKEICDVAKSIWHADRPFIGSHPLAGSEKYGPDYAQADFYENTICLVEKSDHVHPASRELVLALWKELGATVIEIEPDEHDFYLAYTSHLPHVVASALAQVTWESGAQRTFIGGGFRDTTRIAESRPEIWKDILLTNAQNVIQSIHNLQQKLNEFCTMLESGQSSYVLEFFQKGNDARKNLLNP